MRCAECDRRITNAEMWELYNNPHAPASRSLQLLCWDCRILPPPAVDENRTPRRDVLAQAIEVVRSYLARAS